MSQKLLMDQQGPLDRLSGDLRAAAEQDLGVSRSEWERARSGLSVSAGHTRIRQEAAGTHEERVSNAALIRYAKELYGMVRTLRSCAHGDLYLASCDLLERIQREARS